MIDVFSKFKSGVYVVTTIVDDVKYGWTISWCSKVSFNPPLVMVSIGKNRGDSDIFKEAEVFAINILGENGLEVARHFGLSDGENVKNFSGIEHSELETGSPILKNSVGSLDCRLIRSVDAGDHVVFIGVVLDSIDKDGDGLLFSKEVFP